MNLRCEFCLWPRKAGSGRLCRRCYLLRAKLRREFPKIG